MSTESTSSVGGYIVVLALFLAGIGWILMSLRAIGKQHVEFTGRGGTNSAEGRTAQVWGVLNLLSGLTLSAASVAFVIWNLQAVVAYGLLNWIIVYIGTSFLLKN